MYQNPVGIESILVRFWHIMARLQQLLHNNHISCMTDSLALPGICRKATGCDWGSRWAAHSNSPVSLLPWPTCQWWGWWCPGYGNRHHWSPGHPQWPGVCGVVWRLYSAHRQAGELMSVVAFCAETGVSLRVPGDHVTRLVGLCALFGSYIGQRKISWLARDQNRPAGAEAASLVWNAK